MRKLLATAFLGILSFGATCGAAELPIGPVAFALGSPQADAMTLAATHFKILPAAGRDNLFFLAEKDVPNGKVVGGIAFKNGRVSWVQREWGSFDRSDKAAEASQALFAAIESATAASGSAATVSTRTQRVPGQEFRTTTFAFPGHKVLLSITQGEAVQGGELVTVEESISL